jgi:hypothetical protein
MGKKGIRKFGIFSKPKIRMDETLKSIMEAMMELVELQLGTKLDRRVKRLSMIAGLLAQEMNGQAIAYKDDKGQLAWKASEDLQQSVNEA